MKFKAHLIFSTIRKEIIWKDKSSLTYKDIEIGRIETVNWNKSTGNVDIEFKLSPKGFKQIKQIIEK